jgi:hypothetical protein
MIIKIDKKHQVGNNCHLYNSLWRIFQITHLLLLRFYHKTTSFTEKINFLIDVYLRSEIELQLI